MKQVNSRPRRAVRRVSYVDPASDDNSTDSEDVIAVAPRHLEATSPQPETVDDDAMDCDAGQSVNDDVPEPELSDVPDSMEECDEKAIFRSKNRHYNPSVVGFLSLPPELRLKIYKLVLIKKPCVDFLTRRGFSHSSSLLSTCKVVHKEATEVLYSMNHFIFRPTRHQAGSYFEENWRWLGYSSVLQFLEDIGPVNLAHLKVIGLTLQDATPTDEPSFTGETRRFQHCPDLLRCLEILVQHATGLEVLKLQFSGREKFMRKRNSGSGNFASLLSKLKADIVIISEVRAGHYSTAELWRLETTPTGPNSPMWIQIWMQDNRITKGDEDHLVKRMTRDEPINPRRTKEHVRALEKQNQQASLYGYRGY